jgi:hypothetical protein
MSKNVRSMGSPTRRAIAYMTPPLLLAAVPGVAATVEFHKSLRDMTAKAFSIPAEGVPSYQIEPYKADRAALSEEASAVFSKSPVAAKVRGLKAEETESDKAVTFRQGSVEFEVSKTTGAQILLDLDRYTRRDGKGPDTTDDIARRRAQDYLKQSMPDVSTHEVSSARIRKIMDSVGKVDARGATSDVTTGVANYIVVFQREINGIPVLGPGGKIRVYLSSGGDVIGHSKVWRDLRKEPVGRRPVVPPAQVKGTVQEKLSKNSAPKVEVDRFEFGYLGQGRYDRQELLRPVYLVGYTYGDYSKRTFLVFDAYTGEEIAPPAERGDSDKR